MNRNFYKATTVAGLLLLGGLPASVYASAYDSFTATGVSGKVTMTLPGQTSGLPAVQNQVYKLGTQIVTDSGSTLTGSLSAGNDFTVDPNTTVKTTLTSQKNKVSAVDMELGAGKVSADMANYPNDQGFQVNSPLGQSTMAGNAAFSVSYGTEQPGKETSVLAVTRGEADFANQNLSVAAVTAGGQLVVTRQQGGGATYYEISAQGHPIMITVAGSHHIVLRPGSTIRIALDQDHSGGFAAVELTSGTATVGNQTLTSASGAVFVSGSHVMSRQGAPQYMNAVQNLVTAANQASQSGLTQSEINQLNQQQQTSQNTIANSGSQLLNGIFRPPFVISANGPPSIAPQSPSGASLPPSSE